MAEKDLAHSHAHHGEDVDGDHWLPQKTTPQGTLAHSVPQGHEERDVTIGPLIRSFAYLMLVTAVCMVGLGLSFPILMAGEKSKDDIPSPIFVTDQTPPEPRLLPNPQDQAERPLEPLRLPVDYGRDFRKQEKQDLQARGLLEGGKPVIPAARAKAVLAEIAVKGRADAPPTALGALTDASGGTRTEDRTR